VLGDLTFDVRLRDSQGGSSTINIGAYGGGIEEPYQRTGCGSGTGWANEFETISHAHQRFHARRIDARSLRHRGGSISCSAPRTATRRGVSAWTQSSCRRSDAMRRSILIVPALLLIAAILSSRQRGSARLHSARS